MWLSENSTCLGMGIEFVFFHRTEWITQTSCKPNTHTVAAQSSLTSSLFSNSVIHCVFIHCSSHSLLPPPPPTHHHHRRRPIVWPGEGVSYHGGRYNGGIDTGDPMRSARSRSLFLFSWLSKTSSGAIPGECPCRCWHRQRKDTASVKSSPAL